jgi:hypothetical protein
MTKEEIIEMARQAGFDEHHAKFDTRIETFAKLVAEKSLAEHAMRQVQRLGQEIEQAPVAWVSEDVCKGQYIDGRPRKIWWECEKGVGTAFYTAPPQRTWVGLTDDELLEIYGWRKAPMLSDFIVEEAKQELLGALRKVEAKLKEKNT